MEKCKFEIMLEGSNQQIKSTRAKILMEMSMAAQEKIVRELREEKRTMELELMNLTDIYPDSELSLLVVKKDFDPRDVFEKIQDLKIRLTNKGIELKIAEDTYDEWFRKSQIEGEA